MTKAVSKGGRTYYSCGECGFAYLAEELARKCEDWCSKHHSCSLEITRHAVREAAIGF